MAIYHLAVKSVSRSTGGSVVAATAYRSGVWIENKRDGLVHDYRGRTGPRREWRVPSWAGAGVQHGADDRR